MSAVRDLGVSNKTGNTRREEVGKVVKVGYVDEKGR